MNLRELILKILKADFGFGRDGVGVKIKKEIADRNKIEHAVWKIRKFANDEAYRLNNPFEEVSFEGNALVNEGINYLWTIVATDAKTGTPWSNANANLIVGTGSGGEAPGDVEGTFTAGVKKVMDATYPTYGTSQKVTWKSTYGSGDANQVWAEFGVLNAASSGKLLNRKVSAQGTKTSGQTWELILQITLA
jgi:hypothetical protein